MTKPKRETFKQFMRRMHCSQTSFEDLARWYWEDKYEKRLTPAEERVIAAARKMYAEEKAASFFEWNQRYRKCREAVRALERERAKAKKEGGAK